MFISNFSNLKRMTLAIHFPFLKTKKREYLLPKKDYQFSYPVESRIYEPCRRQKINLDNWEVCYISGIAMGRHPNILLRIRLLKSSTFYSNNFHCCWKGCVWFVNGLHGDSTASVYLHQRFGSLYNFQSYIILHVISAIHCISGIVMCRHPNILVIIQLRNLSILYTNNL